MLAILCIVFVRAGMCVSCGGILVFVGNCVSANVWHMQSSAQILRKIRNLSTQLQRYYYHYYGLCWRYEICGIFVGGGVTL